MKRMGAECLPKAFERDTFKDVPAQIQVGETCHEDDSPASGNAQSSSQAPQQFLSKSFQRRLLNCDPIYSSVLLFQSYFTNVRMAPRNRLQPGSLSANHVPLRPSLVDHKITCGIWVKPLEEVKDIVPNHLGVAFEKDIPALLWTPAPSVSDACPKFELVQLSIVLATGVLAMLPRSMVSFELLLPVVAGQKMRGIIYEDSMCSSKSDETIDWTDRPSSRHPDQYNTQSDIPS